MIAFVNPATGKPLELRGSSYVDGETGQAFPVIAEIPRFCASDNYAANFGFQWNEFAGTQLDVFSNSDLSEQRFYGQTGWDPEQLEHTTVLEVGSGAGRFTEVFLRTTRGCLHSIDYSNAVLANWRNNSQYKGRLHLAQASIDAMPFPDGCFDKVFCFGVLQHTPSFRESVSALVRKARVGGEIVVDFYPLRGWYTKIHAKYLLRPFTQRLRDETLLRLIRKNIDWLLLVFDALCRCRLGHLTRFLPITDVRLFPRTLNPTQRREWAIMDTFDALSPEFDSPQRLKDVVQMFQEVGCSVNFAGDVVYPGGSSTVVRAVREAPAKERVSGSA